MTTITNNPIRRTMSLLDEHKESLPEGVYLEMCDNLKKLYLTGEDFARDSYLIDLTMLLKYRLEAKQSTNSRGGSTKASSCEERKKEFEQLQTRLIEQRTLLTKIRPLEKKLRYQIDKLLALSTLGAGTFAARDTEDVERKGSGKKSGDDDKGDGKGNESADPLSFKPDLQGMMKMFENVDNEEEVSLFYMPFV